MKNEDFLATNTLGQSLIDITHEKILLPEFIGLFLESELIVPSAIEAQDDG